MTHRTRKTTAATLLATAAAASLIAGCGGGGGGDTGTSPTTGTSGTLRLALTDAPACGYDAVNVTIEKIRVNQSSTAADADGGWSEIVLSPAKRVNLLNLTNGVLEEMGSTQLPAGRYTQLRLMLAENGGANPRANSVVVTGGSEVALTTPSGTQTGLKLNANIDVASNQTADFVLDFDACKSVVKGGMSGRYLLKPVVSILPRVTTTGLAVEGHVASALGGQAAVSLQTNGVVSRATVADANGRFVLSPVPAGNYDLVVSANGRVTAVMTGVPVTVSGVTVVNTAAAPITPPTTTVRTVSGKATVTGAATIPDATLRALQTVGTSAVEVVSRRVDADSGTYSFSLPTAAPVTTAYLAGATTLTFTASTAAAAKYTVEAAVPGQAVQTKAVDVTAADATASFAFAP